MTATQLTQKLSSHYTDDVRRAAIGLFVVTGNYKAVSRKLNIPPMTLHGWSKSEWWLKEIVRIRVEKSDELDAQVTNSINKAIKSVDERLEQGDAYVVAKTGKVGYKPVSARDSATVLGILYDKRQIMRLLPTSITTSTDSAKLLELKANFEKLAAKNIKEVEGTVVEG